MSYASDLESINYVLKNQGQESYSRHNLMKIDLSKVSEVNSAIEYADPDFVLHLAAESHVDRSIKGPSSFIESNIIGTFNLLESIRKHFENLEPKRKKFLDFYI